MTLMPSLLIVLAGYLLGSISFAVVVSRLMGLQDPRAYGSGNPGATNVLRSGNKAAALLTLLGDAAKGAVAVLVARALSERFGFSDTTLALVGLAAFVGHLLPVFHGFKGGKGVATAAGVLLALSPALGLACLGTWLAVALLSRYSSLAAIAAAICAPLYHLFMARADGVFVALVAMAALLLWRHRPNIAKLMAGTESRIGSRKTG